MSFVYRPFRAGDAEIAPTPAPQVTLAVDLRIARKKHPLTGITDECVRSLS